MKKLVFLLISGLFLVTAAVAGEGVKKAHARHPKGKCFQSVSVQDQMNHLIGYPSDILNGRSQSVIVSFNMDGNTLKITEIASSNERLKQYVMNKLNGKTLHVGSQECSSGTLRLNFQGEQSEGLYFQY